MTTKLVTDTPIRINAFQAAAKGRVKKSVDFEDVRVEIQKLKVREVEAVQAKAKALESEPEDAGNSNMELLMFIIRLGCPDAMEIPDETFKEVSLESLTKLTTDIMRFSGLGDADIAKKS